MSHQALQDAPAREHGCAGLFYGISALLLVVHLGQDGLALTHFRRRIVSEATLDAIDIDARIRLYGLAGLVGILVAVATMLALRRCARRIPRTYLELVNHTSLAGLAFLYLGIFQFDALASLALVFAVHALALSSGFRSRIAQRYPAAAWVGWLASTGVALAFPLFQLVRTRFLPGWLWACVGVLAIGAGLVVGFGLCTRKDAEERATRRSARWLHASMPLAALSLVPFLRDEVYLLLNGHGFHALPPLAIQALLGLAILAWMLLRYRRAFAPEFEFDLARMLGRGSFPLLIAGALTAVGYRPFLEPSTDLLEPANPGLLIQQWFEFGRLPFVETFNVHGLWDSAYGLVYALLSGHPRELHGFYDFGKLLLPVVLLYYFLRRATGNPYLALFMAALLPHADELAPSYCAPALVAVFALDRAARRQGFLAFAGLFLLLAGLAVWRVDIGFAASVAVVIALLLRLLGERDARMQWVSAVAAGLFAVALTVAAWVLACRAAGVGALARFEELLLVLRSNQGFGHTTLGPVVNEILLFHLFVVPVAVFLVGLSVVVERRAEQVPPASQALAPRRFLFLALCFLCAYYFANVPRGLVRHTFHEPGNVYLASFSSLALALWCWWRWGRERPALAFVGLVGLSSLLAFHFPLKSPQRTPVPPARSLWSELVLRLPVRATVAHAEQVLARDGVPDAFAEETFAELKRFLDANLEREATFLDLAHAPMLYIYTHRISPHWLNHLMCVPGEPAQKRVLAELERFDVPLIVLKQDPLLARQVGLTWSGDELDGVPFRLRHALLFEHAYAEYEPFALLDRWHVWLRKGHALAAPPEGELRTRALFEAGVAALELGPEVVRRTVIELAGHFGESQPEGSQPEGSQPEGPQRAELRAVDLAPDHAYFLQVEGHAREPLELELELRLRTGAGPVEMTRRARLPAGALDHALFLGMPESLRALELLRVECRPAGALELTRLRIDERRAPAYSAAARQQRLVEETKLGHLPLIWARHDERRDERRVEQRLFAADEGPAGEVEVALAIQERSHEKWNRGIHRDLAGVLLDQAALEEGLALGDTLHFAGSGPRVVRAIIGRQVLFDGSPLDPLTDGHPQPVRWRRPALRGVLLGAGEPHELELPAARAGRPAPYLVLRVANRSRAARELVVEYGAGDQTRGRFTLRLPEDREVHEHVLRASVHASWWQRPAGWLRLSTRGGAAELLAVELADGP